jgi:hypothetical protein
MAFIRFSKSIFLTFGLSVLICAVSTVIWWFTGNHLQYNELARLVTIKNNEAHVEWLKATSLEMQSTWVGPRFRGKNVCFVVDWQGDRRQTEIRYTDRFRLDDNTMDFVVVPDKRTDLILFNIFAEKSFVENLKKGKLQIYVGSAREADIRKADSYTDIGKKFLRLTYPKFRKCNKIYIAQISVPHKDNVLFIADLESITICLRSVPLQQE